MRRDVLRRVRWGNVALAAAIALALATIIAWPLIAAPSPRLPPDTARPLVSEAPPREKKGGEGAAAKRGAE
jgi:hypothetical protein